jgi:hypothetical protein
MNTWTLLTLITATWLLWALGALHAHHLRSRRNPANPATAISLAPLYIFPLLAFALAKLTDHFLPNGGTRLIATLHLLLTAIFLTTIARQALRARKTGPT